MSARRREPRGRPGPAVWLRRVARAALPSAATLRLSVYATCVFTACGFVAARAALADFERGALAASRELAKLPELQGEHGYETVRVNGARARRASAHTDRTVGEVLDRFEAYCVDNPGAIADALRDIGPALRAPAYRQAPRALKLGVVREENDGAGMIGCFVDEDAPRVPTDAAATLAARAARFVETGNLNAFGRFRLVYAERSGPGDTHVVTSWFDGDLAPSAMFPAEGDAPGEDSRLAPRPPRARRLLEGAAEGAPFGVRVYESEATRDELVGVYAREMPARGFAEVARVDASGTLTRTYLREDLLSVVVAVGEDDGKRYVTIVDAGGDAGGDADARSGE